MSKALIDIIPQTAIDIDGSTVILELICTDALSARVLYEDLLQRIASDDGLTLKLRGEETV